MKVEIEVELPGHIAKDWEVLKIATPVEGDYVVAATNEAARFNCYLHDSVARVILCRKINPRDWWPRWALADSIKFQSDGMIRFSADDGNLGFWRVESNLIDFSWIPEHLRCSGMTIENPWKGEQQ